MLEEATDIHGFGHTQSCQDENPPVRRFNCCRNIKSVKENITLEPMMFLHMCASSAYSVVILQDLYIDRICRIKMGYNETICENLTAKENSHIENEVDTMAAIYDLRRKWIESVFSIILSLFLGSWADKHYTKNTLILPVVGSFFSGVLFTICSFFTSWHPNLLYICSIPVVLTGGTVFLLSSADSFISKITRDENRTFRLGVFQACWILGVPVGTMLGSGIYKLLGFPAVFIAATTIYGLSIVCGLRFIKTESSVCKAYTLQQASISATEVNEETRWEKLRKIFNFKSIKDVFQTFFKPRGGYLRSQILLLIVAMCLGVFANLGMDQLVYLFVRNKFQWGTSDHSLYMAVDIGLQIIGGGVVAFVAMKKFKVGDAKIGLFSSLGYCAAAFVIAFASSSWMMYLGSAFKMFCGLIAIAIPSLLSKCVDKDELGKVFTVLASVQVLMPLVGNAVFTAVYGGTVNTFPGAMYLISAGMNLLIFFTFLCLIALKRRDDEALPLIVN